MPYEDLGLVDVVTLVGPPLDMAACRKKLCESVLHLADARRSLPRAGDDDSDADVAAGVDSPHPPQISRGPMMRSRGSFTSAHTSSSDRTHRAAPYARPSSRLSRPESVASDSSGAGRLAELESLCEDDVAQYRHHPGPRYQHVAAFNC